MLAVMQRRLHHVSWFIVVLLAIELLDELVFGAGQAALPLIRDDLNLDYIQIGLLLAIPKAVASVIELFLGVLGDTHHRRRVILYGGISFGIALLLMGISQNFGLLLLATVYFFPSSGAFVSLSQASLMDAEPHRHEQNMARWAFAGSLGVLGGSLLISIFVKVGLGWREVYLLLGVVSLLLVALAWRYPFSEHQTATDDDEEEEDFSIWVGLKSAFMALKRREVVRWLTLLQLSDLMLDVLLGYLALYFVDVVGVSESQAALAVTVWTGVGLFGDFALIFLLERVKGLTYLRYSVVIELFLYPAFLLVDEWELKLVILGIIGIFNAGWYSILQGQLYTAMRGQSGAVLVIYNVADWFGSLIPFAIGVLASRVGLEAAMWSFVLAPILLLGGLLFPQEDSQTEQNDVIM